MEQEQRSQRHAAAKAFFDALDQFQEVLQQPDWQDAQSQPQSSNASPSQPETRKTFDLADLEAAVADIEEFFQSRQAESTQQEVHSPEGRASQ